LAKRSRKDARIVSTNVQRSFYRNGQVREEVTSRNGRRQGTTRTWHKNGAIALEESYRNGQLHGVCRQWDERGKLLGQYRMSYGTGIQHVWFENGVLQWEHSLVNGMATGPSRLWFQDGSLASEQWFIENREVTSAEYAQAASDHNDWPKPSTNGALPRKVVPSLLEKRAFRFHCQWLLTKPNTRNATEWLNEAKPNARAVGALSGQRAKKVVSEALAAGARRVLAADTYVSKQGKQFADVLLVELPKLKTRREAVRKVFKSLPRPAKCAVQPDSDHGDPWLYVYLG
jgi:hypothetical protein